MRTGTRAILILSASAFLAPALLAAPPLRADSPAPTPSPAAAAVRGLAFAEKDGANWRQTKQCASCHQGLMTAWTFLEARGRGYTVKPQLVDETFEWCRPRFVGIDGPKTEELNSRLVSMPALIFGLMSAANADQPALSDTEKARIAKHLVTRQEADGSWSLAAIPAGNRPPPVNESDEVATLLGYIALDGMTPPGKSPIQESRDRAAAWLAKTPAGDTTQATALRLYVLIRQKASRERREAAIRALLQRQASDGGWPQVPGLASDAYGTGQALYFLTLAGVKPDRREIQRGLDFLARTQREDGSWALTPRAHPGAKPFTHPEPINSFGSAWATMAIMRATPAPK